MSTQSKALKFGFLTEGVVEENKTFLHRYREVVEEVRLADWLGFDFFCTSEQHFTFGASFSSPEVLFSYLFPLTKQIRFRHAVTLLPHKINHPLRVAEMIATEDVLSGGRIELGTGRANSTMIVGAFGVDPDRSRAEWKESLDVIRLAFTQSPFSYQGEFLDIPRRHLIPMPLQQPHPPISVAATSPEMQEIAAREGIGVMTSSYFFGWEWLETLSQLYHTTLEGLPGPIPNANNHFSPLVYTYCAETDAEAKRDGAQSIYLAARLAAVGFAKLAKTSSSYGYMAQAEEIMDRIDDIDWLIEESGTVVCGSPESCRAQIERYVALGADEIIFKIDADHSRTKNCLELLAREVMPHFRPDWFKTPQGMLKGGLT